LDNIGYRHAGYNPIRQGMELQQVKDTFEALMKELGYKYGYNKETRRYNVYYKPKEVITLDG
jgi:hypothetical protein